MKAVGAMLSRLAVETEPDGSTKIVGIKLVPYVRSLLVEMGSGKTYMLDLREIRHLDRSKVTGVRVSRDHDYFWVYQASGNKVDVPYDAVLYHCEPEYEFYKGRQTGAESEADRAARIGSKVRALRKERGLTITTLATRARILRPNVSRLEAGKHVPSLETLEKIASGLGVAVADLIAIHPYREESAGRSRARPARSAA
jgi:DNA-binding XRE family transcriptional regulator